MGLEGQIYEKTFHSCNEIRRVLFEKKQELEELIQSIKKSPLDYNPEMIANAFETYKLSLIDSILKSSTPISPIDMMRTLVINHGLTFDLDAYKAAVREIHVIYKQNPCSNYCSGTVCDRRNKVR